MMKPLATALLLLSFSASGSNLDADLERFLQWFAGEYDNHEQVWLDKGQDVEHVHEHIHHLFLPVEIPGLGDNLFFVRQTMDADPNNVYRLRVYRFSINTEAEAIQLDIFSFKDEDAYRNAQDDPDSLKGLSAEDFTNRPGCEVYWRWTGEHFAGSMEEKACNFVSQRSGKRIFITDDLKLTETELWIRDEAFDEAGERVFGHPERIHHKNRKVRYFTGWAAVRPEGMDAPEDAEDWIFKRFVIHNEGQIVPITNEAGEPSGYSVQLAQLTYQGQNKQPILKIGIIEDATGKTLRYAWANPDAIQIGINLRWMQSGLKQKTERIHFGF